MANPEKIDSDIKTCIRETGKLYDMVFSPDDLLGILGDMLAERRTSEIKSRFRQYSSEDLVALVKRVQEITLQKMETPSVSGNDETKSETENSSGRTFMGAQAIQEEKTSGGTEDAPKEDLGEKETSQSGKANVLRRSRTK
jgi:hypothetical protein